MKKHICIILLLLLIPFLITGCVEGVKEKIIGKWVEVDGSLSYEFFKDGTFIGSDNGFSAAGEYQIVGDDHLILQIGGFRSYNTFTIEGNVLTVYTIFSDEPSILQKVKK